MKTTAKTEATELSLAEAMGYISETYGNGAVSYDKIAKMLQSHAGFEKVRGSTVYRWTQHKPNSKHPETTNRIIHAAQLLKLHLESPVEIRFAVIDGATEMLPVLLLQEYDWPKRFGARVTLQKMESIEDGWKELHARDGIVDIAIGPRRMDIKRSYESVRRFFEIATIPVGGIFPMRYTNKQDFADIVERLTEKGLKVGCLPNADYSHSLHEVLRSKRKERMPDDVPVRNHKEAVDLLREGKIQAVVGHSVFIANCYKSITEHRAVEKGKAFENLRDLETVGHDLFPAVTMDVFINIARTTPAMGQRTLHLLTRAEEYILHNRGPGPLVDKVNEVLGLVPKQAAKSGEQILQEYLYDVKSFEKEMLLHLWKV